MASSLETNKVVAAILAAGIIASGSGVVSRILYHVETPEENAYPIATVEGGGEVAGGAEEAAGEVSVVAMLPAADASGGEKVAKKCAACHNLEEGGANKIGPALWGVLGRDIASAPGFSYSDALSGLEGEWTYDKLAHFLANPKGYAPGTKMAFVGVRKPEDLADLILYLRSLGAADTPLPEAPAEEPAAAGTAAAEGAGAASEKAPAEKLAGAEQAAAVEGAETAAEAEAATASDIEATAEDEAGQKVAATGEAGGAEQQVAVATPAAADQADGIGALLAQADAEAGAKDARKCATCHTFEEGAGKKIGPPLWGVVGRDIASVEGFKYSDALADKEGEWDYAALDAYIADPKAWAPGNKMAFAGIRKPDDRADLILYLRSLSDDPAPLP